MKLSPITNVYISIGSTDMRKSINGLSSIVSEVFELDIFSGNLFAFCNRKRDIVKILFWDKNGFCIWQKRLEQEHFCWPDSEQEVVKIDTKQMEWLLSGLDINKAHKRLTYSEI